MDKPNLSRPAEDAGQDTQGWKASVARLCRELEALHACDPLAGQPPSYQKDLCLALRGRLDFRRQLALWDAATPTLRDLFHAAGTRKRDWAQALVHAFRDPVVKPLTVLKLRLAFAPEQPDSSVLMPLLQLESALADIVPNYRALIAGSRNQAFPKILDLYESDIQPRLKSMIDDLADRGGLDESQCPGALAFLRQRVCNPERSGREHLRPLPPGF